MSPDPATHEDAIDALITACTLDETKLKLTGARGPRWAMVRCSDEVIIPRETDVYTSFSLGFIADDARKLADPLVASTVLPSSSGGVSWPISWPVTWSGVSNTGIVSLFNPGNIAGPIKIRISGPCPPPTITHVGTGAQLVFASSLSLAAGEWLDVDMDRAEVLANGQAARNGFVTSRGFFGFDPGANDIMFGTSGSYDPAALITVTAWPAWK